MRSELIKKIIKETPLEIRLKVLNEIGFIMLITELGFREDKMWDERDEKDNALLIKLIDLAKKHTEDQMNTINKWKEDIEPKYEFIKNNENPRFPNLYDITFNNKVYGCWNNDGNVDYPEDLILQRELSELIDIGIKIGKDLK